MALMKKALLWASENRWLKERLPRYRFVQRAVRRFMPGEELDDAIRVARQLQKSGITAVFTRLGENVEDADEAAAVRDHYFEVLERVQELELDAHISVKLTQLGLDLDPDMSRAHLEALTGRARELDNFVWIDMEHSWHVDSTLEHFRSVRETHPNLGVCLQSYLYRTEQDLEELLPLRPAIRLVKGAYDEPEEIAYPDKADVDANFLALARTLVEELAEHGTPQGFASHDEAMVRGVQELAAAAGIDSSRVEFQMLYGIQTRLQKRLAADGYGMRVLVSYGDAWYPWYMRRLAERPANVWFVLRNLVAR